MFTTKNDRRAASSINDDFLSAGNTTFLQRQHRFYSVLLLGFAILSMIFTLAQSGGDIVKAEASISSGRVPASVAANGTGTALDPPTTFVFTGAMQTYTVPAGVTLIGIQAYGAGGGTGAAGTASTGGPGGKGTLVTGKLAVTGGDVLNIFVGGAGGQPTAGFNGGGTGGNANSGGGGGASDVRFPGATAADRIIVGGGGGGGGRGGCLPANPIGGAGGDGDGNGANGGDSPTTGGVAGGGFGGTGSAFGAKGIGCLAFSGADGASGTLTGIGGNGGTGQICCCPSQPGGGGGGGGFAGGGGGGGGSAGTSGCSGNDKGGGGGGAGGSSYTGGVTGGTTTLAARTGNGLVTIILLGPSAASVSISGRVLTSDGRGLRNANVVLTDVQGGSRRAVTSSFGYYRFDDVQSGATYVMSVTSKLYQFTSRTVSVIDEVTGFDFTPEQGPEKDLK